MKTLTRKQKGFSLIEVLIAVTILSIGLLAIAGLQVSSKQAVYDSVQRTVATQLAQDMIERMRANRGVLDLYVGQTLGGGTISTAPTDCSSVSCSDGGGIAGTKIASYDLWQWERALDGFSERVGSTNTGGLQSPTGCITGPTTGGSGIYRITIAWRGVQSIDNSSLDSCGNSSDLYNEDNNADDNKFRRLISIDTYISETGTGT